MRLKYTNINKLGFALINIKMSLENFERVVERRVNQNLGTDMTIEEIREMPIDEMRKLVERKTGRSMEFSSGTLMGASTNCDGSCSGLSLIGQRLVSHEECENAYQDAVRTPWHEYVRRVYQWFKR